MLTVELNALKFHSYHGLYEGEALVGSDFEVSLSVSYAAPTSINSVADTIDYGALFMILKKAMEEPVPLLEQLAHRILNEVKEQFQQITHSSITIYKLQAPIPSLQGKIGISLHKKYDT